MPSNPRHPTLRPTALAVPGALGRGEANPAQIRKVLRAYSPLQKASVAGELLLGAMREFPGAFDGHARAEVAHILQVLANLSPADARSST